jgi:DNA-binding MarR family transcriptional regulator
VSKLPSELDKRSVNLSLTPLGRVRAEKLESALNNHAAQVFNLIPQDKHAQLEDSLNILITALRQNPFEQNDLVSDAGSNTDTTSTHT